MIFRRRDDDRRRKDEKTQRIRGLDEIDPLFDTDTRAFDPPQPNDELTLVAGPVDKSTNERMVTPTRENGGHLLREECWMFIENYLIVSLGERR